MKTVGLALTSRVELRRGDTGLMRESYGGRVEAERNGKISVKAD